MERSSCLIAVVCVIALFFLVENYPAMSYRGDGRISGDRLFGYSITMKQFSLDVSGEHVFHLAGAPEEDWILRLYAKGETGAQRNLTLLRTRLTASLVDEDGRLICHADGSPGKAENDWQLDETAWFFGGTESELTHLDCLTARLKPSESYSLTITVANPGTVSHVELEPVLEGGQPTWP